MSKNFHHKDKVNNFVALLGESVSSSWDRFTVFVRSVPNHHIDNKSLKEYFYRGQDDNNKALLDTIVRGSYGECSYAENVEKLEKICYNYKACSTTKTNTGRNTFVMQATHNSVADEIYEEMTRMRTDLGLVLKHDTGEAEKVNVVNYLTKPPLLVDEYYYEEDTYVVKDQTGGFQTNT